MEHRVRDEGDVLCKWEFNVDGNGKNKEVCLKEFNDYVELEREEMYDGYNRTEDIYDLENQGNTPAWYVNIWDQYINPLFHWG